MKEVPKEGMTEVRKGQRKKSSKKEGPYEGSTKGRNDQS